jgi:DNA-binding winged helix-turn-helix (wHTH) protein
MNRIFSQEQRGFVLGQRVVFDALNERLFTYSRFDSVLRLAPLDVRILLQFVHAPQTLLRRQALFDQGWRQYGMEVCENSLNQVVHSLREAFRAIDPASGYIKTLPRLGYVLTATVQPWQEESDADRGNGALGHRGLILAAA